MKWRKISLALLLSVGMLFGQGHSDPIQITSVMSDQGFAQVEYNSHGDVYLIAWEDQRNMAQSGVDIYGQLVRGDGSLVGENIPICTAAGHQYWPHIAVDPELGQFLVVFEDQRNGDQNGDVRGVFVNITGNFVDTPSSETDHTFGICTLSSHIYTCSVAYNYWDKVYLVVWGDNRNSTAFNYIGVDVYAQLIAQDGTLIRQTGSSNPDINFAIDQADWYEASVADVTYSEITNEFFVVYGTGMGYVLGQRVGSDGVLIPPEGRAGLAKTTRTEGTWPAVPISGLFNNGPDCFQAKAASRTEYWMQLLKPSVTMDAEVQVIWKGQNNDTPPGNLNDVWGQRIAFFLIDQNYVMKYVDLNGDSSSVQSNFPVSLQPDWANVPDLAYGLQDDEYLVAWGDPRTGNFANNDLYTQRLDINDSEAMLFMADDRVATVTATQNNPIAVTDVFEGSLLGVAHNPNRNEFLCAYVYGNNMQANGADIVAMRFFGSPGTAVNRPMVNPDRFRILPNYPNPFNPNTMIQFELSGTSRVRVSVLDLTGRCIAELADTRMAAGSHGIEWNGKSRAGQDAASGVFMITIETDFGTRTEKMMLIR